MLALGLQPFPDPFSSTDTVRDVGNNECFPFQGLNFCSHFRHMTRTTWWWGWTVSSHSIKNISKQQNENSVSREETCYFNRTETDQSMNESPDPLGPHSWPGCFQPIQCSTKHPVICTPDPNEPPQHLAKSATIDDVGKKPNTTSRRKSAVTTKKKKKKK